MLKRGKNRVIQVMVGLAVSSMLFAGGQEVAMAENAPYIGNSSFFDGFNSLLGIAVVGGMQNATINVSNMNNEVITRHLSVTNMDRKLTEQKIWAEYIHNNSRVDNTAFNITSSFLPISSLVSYNNEVDGLIIGTDFISKENKRMGISFNYGEGYVDNKGDMAITRNDYDYWGMSVYENWKLGKINIMADLGYMKNSGKIKQTNMLIGTELNANVDSNILTAGIRSEFITNVSGLTPCVGLRYVRLVTDEFSTKIDSEVFFNTAKDTQDLLLLPVGLNWSHKDITERGYWKQVASAGMVYAFGDTDATTKFYMPSTEDERFLNFNIKDTRTFVASLGLEGRNDDLTYGVRYQFQESNHEIANGIVVNMQYGF